jgi:peptide/nickel transport system ATP-binding protein/oligopeptide transport system ATP-binding protein
MYGGFAVEYADVKEIFKNPQHPYTSALLDTLPGQLNKGANKGAQRLRSIGGQPPDLVIKPVSCPFAPRCSYKMEICENQNPSLFSIGKQNSGMHDVACWYDLKKGQPRP